IADLNRLARLFDPQRPYLVSEFGTDGYWDPSLTRRDSRSVLLEPSTAHKVASYERGWRSHTAAHRGANIGGVAYCWCDRYEATATWFGLNDAMGHPKPPYFALQRLWKGKADGDAPRIGSITASSTEAEPGGTIEVRVRVEPYAHKPLHFDWQI